MKTLFPAAILLATVAATGTFADSHASPDQAAIVEQALAGGDPAAGEAIFRKCKSCHEIGPDAEAKVGPPLTGIVGSFLGQVDDFRYTDTMVSMGEEGTVWTVENLDTYLTKPRDFVNRTRMSFAGLRSEEERANVIAYLASFSE